MSVEEREAELGPQGGISRRQALKKGAVVGGTVLWATPVVQSIGMSRAFGQQPSPVDLPGPSISFIVARFVCAGTTYLVKLENIQDATTFDCEGPGEGDFCDLGTAGDVSGCDLGLFELADLVFDAEGDLVSVTLDLTCPSGTVIEGAAKCGGECFTAVVSDSGTSVTFTCGA